MASMHSCSVGGVGAVLSTEKNLGRPDAGMAGAGLGLAWHSKEAPFVVVVHVCARGDCCHCCSCVTCVVLAKDSLRL